MNELPESIQVVLRIKPHYAHDEHAKPCLSVLDEQNVQFLESKANYTFDKVCAESVSQSQIFELCGRAITDNCLHGYNGTVMAYGQTGSGKTFTMFGLSSAFDVNFSSDKIGLIPRVLDYLFASLEQGPEYECKCSFLEIYNENVYDLLDNTQGFQSLTVQDNGPKGVIVQGSREPKISSKKDAESCLSIGLGNRKVAATLANRESSRSHAVFTIFLKRFHKSSWTESRINLIDLAGSERQKDTHASGVRLKEASLINQSLSNLGLVVKALVESDKVQKTRHIPFRNSKLTFVLKDSFGGNAKTFLIANVSNTHTSQQETLSTLTFAQRAKLVVNRVSKNEVFTDRSADYHKILQEYSALKQSYADLERQMSGDVSASLKKELESERNAHLESLNESKSLITTLKAKELLVEQLKGEVSTLGSSLLLQQKSNSVLHAGMVPVKERLAELQKVHQECKATIEGLRAHAADLESRNLELDASLKALLAKNEEYKSAVFEFEKKNNSLKFELHQAKNQIDALEGHHNSNQRIQHTLQVKQENAVLREENTKLLMLVKQLTK